MLLGLLDYGSAIKGLLRKNLAPSFKLDPISRHTSKTPMFSEFLILSSKKALRKSSPLIKVDFLAISVTTVNVPHFPIAHFPSYSGSFARL